MIDFILMLICLLFNDDCDYDLKLNVIYHISFQDHQLYLK